MAIKINAKSSLASQDPEVYGAIEQEFERLNNSIELIASENVVSAAVMEAVGSILTNKYAEGYPHKRYYGGCVNVDTVEDLAKDRLLQLFDCKKFGYVANVQPHSGSQANMAVYMALIQPGDRILGMDLSAGGHLTHGAKANFSGKLYEIHSYGTDANGQIDYNALEAQAIDIQPKIIVAGASAYPRTLNFARFREIADKVGAYLVVDMAHIAGLIACGLHPTPFPHAHVVTSTTHKTLRGTRGGVIISKEEFEKKINSAIFPGIQGGPLMHVIAGKAVAFREALKPEFKNYQQQIVKNAGVLSNTLMDKGVNLVSKGTDNHLMLLDLRSLNLTGKDAEHLLESVGITVNKNGIPEDPQPPTVTSGIRIGTPAITTRGFDEADCILLGSAIASVLKNPTDENVLLHARKDVAMLCKKHPLFVKDNQQGQNHVSAVTQ